MRRVKPISPRDLAAREGCVCLSGTREPARDLGMEKKPGGYDLKWNNHGTYLVWVLPMQ